MRYFSTFSGIGGFELGIGERHECVGFSEIDRYATQIYQEHFPNHKNYGDIKLVRAYDLPDFDLLVGGFPCQSFSVAGKRGGFEDTRGTLFFEIARIIRKKQPRLLCLENVKGLLSHDGGRTFSVIVNTLDELGYDVQWQVLNSKDFGVPQNRERVYIVGHLRGTPRPQVFPIGYDAEIPHEEGEAGEGRAQTEISHTLRGPNIKADQVFIVHNVYGGFGEKEIREFHDYSPTIRTPQGGGHIPMVVQRPRGKNKGSSSAICPTITGKSFEHNNTLGGVRRLTPTECERLQGFPDSWTASVSDTQRYKTLGNAVTVNAVRAVMKRLLCKRKTGSR